MIDLCTLGTGGTLPLPTRALASLYVRVNGRALLIDCGENTQTEIRRLGWGFRCIDAVLLTHYHGDHCSGLPGFLMSLGKAGRTEPLHLYGPTGLSQVLNGLCVIMPRQPYPIYLHEYAEPFAFRELGMDIRCFRLDHGVPCYGYRLSLPRSGAFQPEKAKALGVPVTLWKQLKAGETVTAEGRTVRPEDVTGGERPGISFVYATDTRPVDAIAEAGAGTQLMILEGMYGDASKKPQALKNKHMLYEEAAALAKRAGTERLLLTHFSTSVEEPEAFLPAAQAVFPETACACDGMTLTLRYP